MSDKLEALRLEAETLSGLMMQLAENEIDSDSFAVMSDLGENGTEHECDLPITETALRAAAVIGQLLAALEEKDQQIKELEEFAKLALEKIPNEKSSPDFYIVGNGPCFLAYPESMGPEARGDLAGNLRKVYLSSTHWKERAKAAEQRLELVREQRDNELRNNAELQQRLQQPIKLPDIRSEDYHESGWFQHMKYYRDVVRSIQALELKVEGE